MGQSFARVQVVVYVNGRRYELGNESLDCTMSLAGWLRQTGISRGTKVGCSEGVCGSCTVMVSRREAATDGTLGVVHRAVNACLVPVLYADQCHVTTIEGSDAVLKEVQARFAQGFASQCGFCSPGMILSLYSALRNKPTATVEELQMSIDGNLCRCTGYRPILDVARSLSSNCGDCSSPQGCCMTGLSPEQQKPIPEATAGEFIFPPALLKLPTVSGYVEGARGMTYVRPTSLDGLLGALAKFGARSVLLGGCTSKRVSHCTTPTPAFISTLFVVEMASIQTSSEGGVSFGGAVTLKDTQTFLDSHQALPHSPMGALKELLPWIGSSQVRGAATWGGAIALSEANSDLVCFLLACKASVDVGLANGKLRQAVPLCDLISPATGRVQIEPLTVVVNVFVPPSGPMSFVMARKFGPRMHLARSTLGGTAVVRTTADGMLKSFTVALVGVLQDRPVLQTWSGTALQNPRWSITDARGVIFGIVSKELQRLEERNADLIDAFLLEFLTRSSALLVDIPCDGRTGFVPSAWRPQLITSQSLPPAISGWSPVGEPLKHCTAVEQCNGTALFVDDESAPVGTLVCVPVLAKVSRASRFTIKDDKARTIPGVIDILYAADVLGTNDLGEAGRFFAVDTVEYYGETLAVVIADSRAIALEAQAALQIEYQDVDQAVISTLSQAIQEKSEHPWPAMSYPPNVLDIGNVAEAFSNHEASTIQGSLFLGSSEHFYLEPHSCLAIPKEGAREIHVQATAQSISMVVDLVSNITSRPHGMIHAECRRIGGGFGGKGIPALALPALAAAKLNRPCKMTLSRMEDILMSTKRAETRFDWKASVNRGRIVALETHVYYAAGAYPNSCKFYAHLMGNAGMASYEIPNYRCHMHLMRVTRAPTGPLRGAGIPQGALALETIMERVSHTLGVDPHQFRAAHLRSKSGSHWLGAPMHNVFQKECWDEVLRMSSYESRAAAVAAFNAENRFKKRGIAAIANVHPFNWKGSLFLQQSRGVVHVQADGSVLIAHQGIEMGQGVHQKMIQIVAHELSIPVDRISINANHSSVLGSTVVDTGGSSGNETNGLALKAACRKIKKKMQSICSILNLDPRTTSFDTIASSQQAARMALSALAAVQTYDPVAQAAAEKIDPRAVGGFKYYCYGAAVVEVELDVLTGAYQFPHASICAEWGRSLSAGIDIGQLEGGFLQSMSWATREQIRFCERTGRLLNAEPEHYYIATAFEAPREFHSKLLSHAAQCEPNPINSNVYNVKGTGEPGYNLGAAAFIAIQRAVLASRAQEKVDSGDTAAAALPATSCWLNLPATHEAVRKAIGNIKLD